MERFAAESLTAERNAHIKAALKANTPWTDLMDSYGLTQQEIEKIIIDSVPGATRRGSAVVVKQDEPLIVQRRGRR